MIQSFEWMNKWIWTGSSFRHESNYLFNNIFCPIRCTCDDTFVSYYSRWNSILSISNPKLTINGLTIALKQMIESTTPGFHSYFSLKKNLLEWILLSNWNTIQITGSNTIGFILSLDIYQFTFVASHDQFSLFFYIFFPYFYSSIKLQEVY